MPLKAMSALISNLTLNLKFTICRCISSTPFQASGWQRYPYCVVSVTLLCFILVDACNRGPNRCLTNDVFSLSTKRQMVGKAECSKKVLRLRAISRAFFLPPSILLNYLSFSRVCNYEFPFRWNNPRTFLINGTAQRVNEFKFETLLIW